MSGNHGEHIRKIRDDFQASQRVKDSLNNSIQALAKDLYSKDTHFIFELIQNAEDNTYHAVEPSLSFRLVATDPTGTKDSDGVLIVQNNEIGFSSDNVDAICAVGKTTKSKIQGYIGEKGIGFKSVFRITSSPHIFSNGYSFCLPEHDEETGLGYIVPKWIDRIPEGIDPSQTTIILPLDKTDFRYEKIERMLREIEPETIIFLSKLKVIKVETDTGDTLTILKDDQDMPQVQIMVEGTMQGESFSKVDEFLLYRKAFDKPSDVSHEKRIGIDKRDVSIVFPTSENKESAGRIFAYLPVRSDTGLPFLINADFILPSSREEIRGNVPWNQWLMDCVANLLAYALPRLKEKGLLTVDLLEALAKRMNELDQNSMFYPIVEAVRGALLDQELLPADDETFVSARNVKLARGAELRKLITRDHLKELFQSKDEIKWLSREITQDRTPDLRSYLMSKFDVEEIRPERFAQLITDYFLEAQTDDWIIQFYNFLGKDKSDLWKKPDSILRQKKILRLEDNSHVIPFQPDGNPNAYLPSSSKTKFPIIKRDIFNDKGAEEFLRNLRLFEPDLFAEVIEFVLPKYIDHPSLVDFQDNIEDLRKVNKLINTPFREEAKNSNAKLKVLLAKLGSESLFDSEIGQISNLRLAKFIPRFLKILLPSIKMIFANNKNRGEYKSAEEIYLNTTELHMYFENNPNTWFIDKSYPADLEQFFKELSIGDIPRVNCENKDDRGYVIIQRSHGSHKRGLNGFDPHIKVDGLKYAIKHPSIEKSLFIWNRIAISNIDCIRGVVESSTRQDYANSNRETMPSIMGSLLLDSEWIPGLDGRFRKPKDFPIEELPKEFSKDETLCDILGMGVSEAEVLAEKYGVKVEHINFIKLHLEEFEKWKTSVINRSSSVGDFPEVPSRNSERREEKLQERLSESPEKSYVERKRSVRISKKLTDPSIWLKAKYTNEQRQMICQICRQVMPFKKPNGEYYFEAVEITNQSNIEHEELHLALCPTCAAKYKIFVKNDNEEIDRVTRSILEMEGMEIPIKLDKPDASIRFVDVHFADLKTIFSKSKSTGVTRPKSFENDVDRPLASSVKQGKSVEERESEPEVIYKGEGWNVQQPKELVQCPHCHSQVRSDRFEGHIERVHSIKPDKRALHRAAMSLKIPPRRKKREKSSKAPATWKPARCRSCGVPVVPGSDYCYSCG